MECTTGSLVDIITIPRLEYNCIYFSNKHGAHERPVVLYLVSNPDQLDCLDKHFSISKSTTQVNVEFIRRRLIRPDNKDRYVIICTKLDRAVFDYEKDTETRLTQMICLSKQFISPRRGLTFTRFRRKLPIELQPPMTMLPLFKSWLAAHAKPIIS